MYVVHRIGISGAPLGPHELGFDPALCPASRAHLYCAAYERPKSISAAKGKVFQVGGEFCKRCLLGLILSTGGTLARGHNAHLWGLAACVLATCVGVHAAWGSLSL